MRRSIAALLAASLAPACSLVLDFDGDVEQAVFDAAPGSIDASSYDAGPPPADADPLVVGCADAEREGFVDVASNPSIAGCSGGFSVPGVITVLPADCDPGAGDDAADPSGVGCNVGDLCAKGWHVCTSPGDVSASSSTGCVDAVPGTESLFFVTRQSSPGGADCIGGTNDLFGCGSIGGPVANSCAPLDRFSGDLCATIGAPWACGADGAVEATAVSKTGPEVGGALCCQDPP